MHSVGRDDGAALSGQVGKKAPCIWDTTHKGLQIAVFQNLELYILIGNDVSEVPAASTLKVQDEERRCLRNVCTCLPEDVGNKMPTQLS